MPAADGIHVQRQAGRGSAQYRDDRLHRRRQRLHRRLLGRATAWPHDPRAAYRTLRYITDWESLCRAYRASFEVARQEPERYARMSAHASASLERFCSRKLAVERLRRFLDEAAQGDPADLQSIPA